MTPQAQLATLQLYYVSCLILLFGFDEGRANDCADVSPTEWTATKVTTPSDWINNVIQEVNSIRKERGYGDLERKDELCKMAQFCATSRAKFPIGHHCECLFKEFLKDKDKVEDYRSFQYLVPRDIFDTEIEKLKKEFENNDEWDESHLFLSETKYMCIAYKRKDDGTALCISAAFQDVSHIPPPTAKRSGSTGNGTEINEDDICPEAPDGWSNTTVTTFDYWIYATNETTNYFRKKHQASHITNHTKLCQIAQFRADEMAKNDKVDEEGKSGCSESIWVYKKMDKLDDENPKLMPNPGFALGVWHEESEDYNYAKGPEKGKVTKHFTQLVWNDTKLHCVVYAVNKEKTKSYVVAEYWPPGNIDGEYQKNVFAVGIMLIGSATLLFISLVFGLFGMKYTT